MILGWEQIVRNQLGSYAWLLDDIDRDKFPDTFKVLQDAVEQRWYESNTGLQRFAAAMQATSFFEQIQNNKVVQQIEDAIGVAGLREDRFGALIGKIVNYGLTGEELKREAYAEAFRRNNNGNYVNPAIAERIRNTTTYKQYEAVGRAYFSKVPDRQIEKVLSGQMTIEDLNSSQREIAKGKYQHLSSMLDKGLTMEEITASYRSQAAAMLEVDEATIDMGSAKFESAYSYGDAGTPQRLMTAGEWERMIRSDNRYGWNKTENAKKEARQLGQSLAAAFGRLM